jgi:hypothetical protein
MIKVVSGPRIDELAVYRKMGGNGEERTSKKATGWGKARRAMTTKGFEHVLGPCPGNSAVHTPLF